MINNLGQTLLAKLHELKQEKGGDIDVGDVDKVINEFITIIKAHVNSEEDINILADIEKISNKICQTKNDISSVDAEKISGDFPLASDKLKTITEVSEKSAEDIMQATEEIQAILPKIGDEEIQRNISNNCAKIFEACSFQDLTGQRIAKIIETIDEIESIVSDLLISFGKNKKGIENKTIEPSTKGEILSGPQFGKDAPTQQDIDDLFNNL
jgi:chemotaxis protein CheZ